MGAAATPELVTLSFVCSRGHVLLIRSSGSKDRFRGLWNGLGGKVRPGEDVREAARREIVEESGLDVGPPRLRAIIHETALLGGAHLLFVFTAELDRAPGPLPESREGTLAWFDASQIPWHEAVPDLRTLLPRVTQKGELLFGTQEFDGSDHPLRLELR